MCVLCCARRTASLNQGDDDTKLCDGLLAGGDEAGTRPSHRDRPAPNAQAAPVKGVRVDCEKRWESSGLTGWDAGKQQHAFGRSIVRSIDRSGSRQRVCAKEGRSISTDDSVGPVVCVGVGGRNGLERGTKGRIAWVVGLVCRYVGVYSEVYYLSGGVESSASG